MQLYSACAGAMTSVLSKIFGNPGSTEFWSTLRSNGLGPAAEERKISSDKFDNMIMLIKTRVERLAVGLQSLEDEPFTRDSSILCESRKSQLWMRTIWRSFVKSIPETARPRIASGRCRWNRCFRRFERSLLGRRVKLVDLGQDHY